MLGSSLASAACSHWIAVWTSQAIAETWPQRLDDTIARRDWGWEPEYSLDAMSADMLDHLSKAGAAVRPEAVEALTEDVRRAAEKREQMMKFLAAQADETVKV